MTPRRRAWVVGSVSASTLAFEILLVRAFAIEHIHHLAFMVIGVAMLGVGVAGVAGALARPDPRRAGRWFRLGAIGVAATLVVSPAALDRVPLDPTTMLSGLGPWTALAAMYLVLAVPFAAGALVVLCGLLLERERTGTLYGASFAGAALGVLTALAGSAVAMPDRALALPAAVATAGAVLAVTGRGSGRGDRAALFVVALAAVGALVRPPWRVDVAPHKSLPQIEAFPDAERLDTRPHPAGWVTAVRAPAFRHAPGLSLRYADDLPSQVGLFVDGDLAGAAPSSPGTTPGFFDWLPSAAPYSLGATRRVAVLAAGGGSEVASALSHGAARVVAVEAHGGLVALIEALGLRSGPAVEWVSRDVRSYAAAAPERFDLVAVQPGGGLGGNAGGVHALREDYLHTVEAYEAYLGLTAPGGVVSLTSWLTVPPRRTVRTILTAGHALAAAGGDPATGLIVVRSWATVTVVLKPAGFDAADVSSMRRWARSRGFDLDWYPGMEAPESRFHFLDEPVPHEAAAAAAAGPDRARAFADAYPFDVRPVTDARPYPDQFLRLGDLAHVMRSSAGDALPFTELGVVAVLATLVQSVVLGAVLMIAPAALGGGRKPAPRPLAYFVAIGFGYMLVEIAAIQQLTLLLGRPAYAVSAVLVTLLVSSGLGSAWSDRLHPSRSRTAALALAAAVAVYAAALVPLVHMAQPWASVLRSGATVAFIAPLGFVMGIPFPTGFRGLAPNAGARAWAWAGNGFASVVATPLAMLVALRLGSPAVLVLGAAAYGAAALAATGRPANPPPVTAA